MTEYLDTLPPIPPTAQTNTRHHANRLLAEELRTHPGKWVRYPHPVSSPVDLRYRIAAGRVAAFGAGFDAMIRDGQVYVRFIPRRNRR